MTLYPNGQTPFRNSPGVDPSKFSVKTLEAIASFHRIVLNYLRMKRLLAEHVQYCIPPNTIPLPNMNRYEALEVKGPSGEPTGRFHYTKSNDGRTWPIGYCAQNCPGHASAEEAQAHYKQFLLDTSARYDQAAQQPFECMVCRAPTDRLLEVGTGIPQHYYLCPEHNNRAGAEQVVRVGTSSSSY